MEVTIERYQIDVMEAEQNIERTQESITATHGRIEEKKKELQDFIAQMKEQTNG